MSNHQKIEAGDICMNFTLNKLERMTHFKQITGTVTAFLL